MKINALLDAIDEELARLRQAKNLLRGAAPQASRSPHAESVISRKRVLSEEARQRIVDAQKRRWAAQRLSA